MQNLNQEKQIHFSQVISDSEYFRQLHLAMKPDFRSI